MACLDETSYLDFSANAMSLQDYGTTPFQLTYPLITTPLVLPRDWPDNYYSPSNDFQSNHLENAQLNSVSDSPLSGLGIRNIELPKDCESRDCETFGTHGVYEQHIHELRHGHRNHRKDSIFVSQEVKSEFDGFNHGPDSTAGFNSSWSFSSILKAAEIAADNFASDMQSSFSSKIDLGESTTFTSDSGADIGWSFEQLSASTGMSMADFAAHVSATAEATLKRMSDDSLDRSASLHYPGDFQWFDDFNSRNPTSMWLPKTPEPPLPPVHMDMHVRSQDASWNSTCGGVNPADISSVPISLSPPALASGPGRVFLVHPDDIPLPPQELPVENPTDNDSNIHDYGMPSDQSTSAQSALVPDLGSPYQETYTLPRLNPGPPDVSPRSEDAASVFQSPSSSEYSPHLQLLGMKRALSSRINKRRTRSTGPEFSDTVCADTPFSESQNDFDPKCINLGTPVFDAHRGIDIEELKSKAERYRLRNNGRDYDKRWLISFAGKLSARGELVDEFRCYVAGCKQSNKRRDHILIHVGAHLDQRPFKCMHCSSRFLRKNECKRHELSHTGIRPFSCHLCPSPATTFVRQDLLKRHMKRTHRMDIKTEKENVDTHRPKKRARR
ncbi:hypothetical protein GALMADRAFT_638962 [Galerina marginata CBS 339.88]|uniref:C2H2-type domain-containing protein n=1 Tax=Galerina marginata (strain CBS 339.88) TaxID=685588 RepID=A0A067TJS9_GALM3|nr:hypothetical protein GALMADRAFT_638962 [Galerina marginata CBS 339.88]